MMTLTLAAVYLLPLGPAAEPGYPNPKLLVEPEELARSADKFRVLDVRGKAKYDDGPRPRGGAGDDRRRGRRPSPRGRPTPRSGSGNWPPSAWRPTQPVVVVSDDVRNAARAWWLLSLAGVPDVRLLNGGWDAYTAAKLPVSKESATATAPPHDWKPAPERQATKDDVAGVASKKRPGRIIDARSEKEYAAGHIPGAVRLEWSELLDPKTQEVQAGRGAGEVY